MRPQPEVVDNYSEQYRTAGTESQFRASGTHVDDTDSLDLEGDLYTNAFISCFDLPGEKKGQRIADHVQKVSAICLMFLVTIIQLMMAWAVYLHVWNDLIQVHERPLLTAYEMFIGSNITIPLKTTEALCGEWEDHEMKDFAMGPLSTMKMHDGTTYAADDSYSLFYNVKQPTRTWNYASLGDHRSVLDDVLFIISEGVTLNPFTPSGYSLLFVLTLSIFYLTLIVEFRRLVNFGQMLLFSAMNGGCRKAATLSFSPDSGKWYVEGISLEGHIIGWLALLCRVTVAVVLLLLGTLFLIYTTLKIDLILNGLALVFLLELDQIIYEAVVPTKKKQLIEDIEPISYQDPGKRILGAAASGVSGLMVMMMFPTAGLFSMATRWYQVKIFQELFKMTTAICLFAGPTTPFARHDIVHPVAGFCDSLLGVKCAPHVVPQTTADEHGYCIITDQTTTNGPTVQFYLEDPAVFANRYNADGSEKIWPEWGVANPTLYKSDLWMDGPYQDILRKNCMQLYQKTVKPDDVIVDDDVGETMDGAPFECPRDKIFEAVFGEVEASVDKMSIRKMMHHVRDVRDPLVVDAIHKCNKNVPAPKASAPAAATESLVTFHTSESRRQKHRHRRTVGHGRKGHGRHLRHKHHHHREDDEGRIGATRWFSG